MSTFARLTRALASLLVLALAACSDHSGEDTIAGDTGSSGTASTSTAASTTGNDAGMNPCVGACVDGTCCQWLSGEVGIVDYVCEAGAWVMADGPACVGTGSGGATGSSSDGGGSGDASTGSGAKSYSTEFDGSENPLSEGGVWTNGGEVGLDWQDQAKDGGVAFGTGFSAGYDDCIAHLSGFAADHYAEANVHVVEGYTPPSSHEVELLLRFEITANSARGYEVLCGYGGAYSQIVRWNGPLDDFTYLETTGPGFGALVAGDVIRAEVVGDTITAYKNGEQVLQATDATWSDGNPGMGFFIRPGDGAVPSSYCYTAYAAGDL